MSDKAFVASAKESWARVLNLQDKPGFNANALAIAAALWATTNVDRLIAIAERKS